MNFLARMEKMVKQFNFFRIFRDLGILIGFFSSFALLFLSRNGCVLFLGRVTPGKDSLVR